MKIEIKGASIHYEMYGEGIPFLMLHGFPMTGEAIGKAIEPAFTGITGYQRIYPDMPGMGDSTAPDWVHTSDDIVEILSEFIEKVIPEKHFLIGGFSYGGYICRALLKRFQARIDGLFLMAPTVIAINSERDVPPSQIIVEDPAAVAMIPKDFRPMVLGAMAVITKPVIERIRDEILPVFSKGDKEFLACLRQNENFSCSHDVDDLATPFDKPTLDGKMQEWVMLMLSAYRAIIRVQPM